MTIASHGYLEVDAASDVKVRRAAVTPGVLIVLGNEWTITAQPEAARTMAEQILATLDAPAPNVLRLPMGKARQSSTSEPGDAA